MDAKVKDSVACHRIPEIRGIRIDEGQRPTFARDRTSESINNCHIAFGVDVNEKDAEGPLSMKRSNYGGLECPKFSLSRVVEESVRMKPITMDGTCGRRRFDDLQEFRSGVSNLRAVSELLEHCSSAASTIGREHYIKRLSVLGRCGSEVASVKTVDGERIA